jgi:hypothetical protein
MSRKPAVVVDEIARELDLVVFRLERSGPDDPEPVVAERRRIRKELEQLRDRLSDVARDLDG